jgi:hypothetical protein
MHCARYLGASRAASERVNKWVTRYGPRKVFRKLLDFLGMRIALHCANLQALLKRAKTPKSRFMLDVLLRGIFFRISKTENEKKVPYLEMKNSPLFF